MLRIAALLMTMTVLTASAEETVKTRAGDLKIAGELYEPKLLLNGKVLGAATESFSYRFEDLVPNKFVVKDADVILVADALSATCTTWFFVTVPIPPAAPSRTKSFGMMCGEGELPDIVQKGDVLTIKASNGDKTKIFKYINGKVR